MSGSNGGNSQPLPIVAAASLCLALLGFVVPRVVPLESSRPEAVELATDGAWIGIEDVESRLWQDPLKVVGDHQGADATDGSRSISSECTPPNNPLHHTIDALLACIDDYTKNSGEILALGVLVSGGPYPEDAEFRMRTRYAVLSGLAKQGFSPKDPKHIGYFQRPSSLPMLQEKVPFEWFVDSDKRTPRILLLWLDESGFANKPLTSAQQLIAKLASLPGKHEYETNASNKIRFHFIGPSSSDTLLAMQGELFQHLQTDRGQTDDCDGQAITAKSWFCLAKSFTNAAASIDLDLFTDAAKRSYTNIDFGLLEDNRGNPMPLRTTLKDTDLARGLLRELKLRGVPLNCGDASNFLACRDTKTKSHIALVSEWDTLYGREAFPRAFAKVLREEQCDYSFMRGTEHHDDCLHQRNAIVGLNRYSYMRGLDGGLPNKHDTNAKQENKIGLTDLKSAYVGMERPEGQSQKDYLRRLADQVEATHQKLIDTEGEGFKAIGVVGSDTYDKLLVLKALRAKFPGMLFFTTDLDARLIHPDEFEFTRNLLVASSFGLELNSTLQGQIPPFRDTYQIAYFLASQIAVCSFPGSLASECAKSPELQALTASSAGQRQVDQALCSPQIFELGLNLPIHFDTPPFDQSAACYNDRSKSVHPDTQRIRTSGFWQLLAAVLVLLTLLAMLLLPKLRQLCKKAWTAVGELIEAYTKISPQCLAGRMLTICGLAFLTILPAIALASVFWAMGKEEPFYWAQGVSMWPTELIRLSALFLGIIFLRNANHCIHSTKKKLCDEYGLDMAPINNANEKTPNLLLRLWEQFKHWREWLALPWADDKAGDGPIKVNELWGRYCAKTTPENLWIWSGFATLLFFSFGWFLMRLTGGANIPYRGDGMLLMDRLALFPSVIFFILLIMHMYAYMHCNAHLIEQLAKAASIWPEQALEKFALRPLLTNEEETTTTLRKRLQEKGRYFLDDVIDIHFITDLTHQTGNIIYCPFFILALLVFARSRMFDNWHLPPALTAIFLLCALLSVASVFRLRRATQVAKEKILGQLTSMFEALATEDSEVSRKMAQRTQKAIDETLAARKGAFLPLAQEPALQALMLPLGGWGGQELLRFIVTLSA